MAIGTLYSGKFRILVYYGHARSIISPVSLANGCLAIAGGKELVKSALGVTHQKDHWEPPYSSCLFWRKLSPKYHRPAMSRLLRGTCLREGTLNNAKEEPLKPTYRQGTQCVPIFEKPCIKGTLLGTPNREPQEYSRYIIGIYLPGSLYSIIFLLYSWGSLFGVPSRVPLCIT